MKLVYGGYGHHPSGKQYVYWASDNFKTGQQVVVPVANKDKSKDDYKTMFTIIRSSSEGRKMSSGEVQRLLNNGITVKEVTGRKTLKDLPTGKMIKELNGSKKDWKEMSDVAYDQKIKARLEEVEI